jgi:hypothetical protein
MTIYCLPLISPGDYETFRRLLNNDLPDTYNEWSNLHLKKLSDVRRQGEVCQEIKVQPDEFARFAAASRYTPNYDLLRHYVANISGGHPY